MSKDKYVMIMGASFINSGAESMTNIAVAEVKKRLPNCKIVLGTSDQRVKKDIDAKIISYQFPIEEDDNSLWGYIFKMKLDGRVDSANKFKDIINNTVAIIDISGYAFTTKFGITSVYSYLHRLHVAKRHKIPYYIMPQSFGPIEYSSKHEKLLVDMLIKMYFGYPEIICAREMSGYRFMSGYGLKNLRFAPDMVLLYPYDIVSMRTRNADKCERVYSDKKKVAVIPNQKIYEKTKNGNKYMTLLEKYMDVLLDNKFEVHIIEHCGLDKKLCKKLYSGYEDNKSVIYHGEAMDSEEYLQVVQNMEFVIASRYHSIVHGYREHIPSVALGWEDKYNHLLKLMDQKNYCVDCREDIDMLASMDVLKAMIDNYDTEKEKIKLRLSKVRKKYGEHTKYNR